MNNLTPKKIVKELDKYIIGQDAAKRAVAIALRNRWRRQHVEGNLRDEIMPNNIILIGPTGVGKTEIARRLSEITNSPFIKVEASKFTEVGYVGKDVESMIRELMSIAVTNVRSELTEKMEKVAREHAINSVLKLLLPKPPKDKSLTKEEQDAKEEKHKKNIEKFRKKLLKGDFDDKYVELNEQKPKMPQIEFFSNTGLENFDMQIGDLISGMIPISTGKKKQKYKVSEAIDILMDNELDKLVKKDKVIQIAKESVENNGIIFIDEIDKIANDRSNFGNDVSRSGVQRDLLPIIEGSNVNTKYGIIDTSHILFIAAGAFSVSKPSDLIPELQGRFPIREELNSLTQSDFEKILIHPRNALTKQYKALLKSEKVTLTFSEDSIKDIARYAALANEKMEDIGARRLHTIINSILEEYLFEIPSSRIKKILITKEIVDEKLDKIIKDEDLSKYIL